MSSVCVVIPTYNERENILPLLKAVSEKIPEARILVVDDASPDGTGQLIEAAKASFGGRLECLHRTANRGYGPSVADGMRWALAQGAEKIIQMDSDHSHDPKVLPRLLEMASDYDLVLGSRYAPGGSTPDWPLSRKILSRGANFYARTLLGLPYRDLTTGFRCMDRRIFGKLDLAIIHCAGYGFLTEMVYRVHQAGFSIGECPIIFRDRTFGESKMGSHIALEAAVQVLRMRFASRSNPTSGASGDYRPPTKSEAVPNVPK